MGLDSVHVFLLPCSGNSPSVGACEAEEQDVKASGEASMGESFVDSTLARAVSNGKTAHSDILCIPQL